MGTTRGVDPGRAGALQALNLQTSGCADGWQWSGNIDCVKLQFGCARFLLQRYRFNHVIEFIQTRYKLGT